MADASHSEAPRLSVGISAVEDFVARLGFTVEDMMVHDDHLIVVNRRFVTVRVVARDAEGKFIVDSLGELQVNELQVWIDK